MSWGKSEDNKLYYVIVGVVIILIVFGIYYWQKPTKTTDDPSPVKNDLPPNPEHETPLQEDDNKIKPTFVMFYADWCGHSRSALPEWKKLEDVLRGSPIATLSLDDASHKKDMVENGIKGYPTIRMYPEGYPSPNFVDYTGPRTVEAFMNFIKSGGRS